MELNKFSFQRLEEICISAISKYLSSLPKLDNKALEIIHRYLRDASPFTKTIANRCYYHFSANKSLMFIPFLLKSELILSDQNIIEVLQWLEINDPRHRYPIKKLVINAPRAENYFLLLPFLSKMTELKWLELNVWTTDDVLAIVSITCKHLEVLDCRNDGETAVTDVGMGYLSQCKTLHYVLFSNIEDEFDYEEKCKFTGKGIALLMLSLSNLKRIECPEYLLRDAINYIYQMNFQKPVLPIKSLHLPFPDVPCQTIGLLPYMCPHLETLSAYVPFGGEVVIDRAIKRLPNLQKIKLKFEERCNMDDFKSVYNCEIVFLIIEAQYLHEDDIKVINQKFSHLNTLVLKMHSFGFVPKEDTYFSNDLFSHLKILEFDQNVSGKLFRLINQKVAMLKELYCQHAFIYDFKTAMKHIIDFGGWSQLKILAIPQCEVLYINHLFDCNLLKLSQLQYLATKFCQKDKNCFASLLAGNKLTIHLCEYEDLVPPSKQFMSI